MRNIFLFCLLCLAACQSIPAPKGIAAHYKPQLPEPALATIRVNTFISYDSLFGRFTHVGQQLISAPESSTLGFPYSGKLDQKIRYQVDSPTRLQVMLPMQWEAKPQFAGISAGTLAAKSIVGVNLQLSGKTLATYRIEDLQLKNQWTDKPVVKVMGFPVQVSGLVDQVVVSKLPSLSTDLAKQLNLWLAPTQVSTFFKSGIILPTGIQAVPLAFDVHDLTFMPTGIQGKLLVQSRIQIGLKTKSPVITPVYSPLVLADNQMTFGVYMSLDEIRTMLAVQLKTDVSQIALKVNEKMQDFECAVSERGSERMRIHFIPVLIEDNAIGIQVNSIELGSLGLMKSMFSTSIKRKIVRGIHGQRMKTDQLLSRLPNDFQGIQGTNLRIRLESIYYSQDMVQVLGKLAGDWTLRK
jgi:hypothetical protein